jgi:hypothetical protein
VFIADRLLDGKAGTAVGTGDIAQVIFLHVVLPNR